MKTRMACFCLLAAVLLMAGCAAPTYYGGLTDQRDEKALSAYRDGLGLMGAQDYRGAITELKKAVIAEPNLTDAYLGLSRSYFAVGDMDMALYYNVKYAEEQRYRQKVYDYRLN
jgi:Tfp pilus assembly protein PilF